MFYFMLFYIIPCLFCGWYSNKLYSSGELDYSQTTILMLIAITPVFNIFLTLYFIRNWYESRRRE